MFFKLILTGILVATIAAAQGRGGGSGGDMGELGGAGGNGGGRGGGAEIPTISSRPSRLELMVQALKLNKDQRKQVKTVMDDAQKEATPVRDQLAKSRLAIGEAVQAAKSQDEINQLVNSEAAVESQMGAIELNAFAKIFKDLDKDQQSQSRALFQMMKGIFNGKNWNAEE